ncbi:hypothetical protein GAP32_018 [Cronobacter phage vB_CsaM_GAP32]|uniref:Uncharacterized protein n=1 Tax=Cronobacter phage vB_CsaM_GAP32 TaxID=1141136 RepID=K4F9D7_9CAUD|nr:hypothetical protein GAP32_018 [Cronobacter phage vB_CsaM_GAP32]AFC21465.1 hypothetical protein GAP32_018 [Cronobacter phage vB_CsaM_GAP32]
MFYIAEVKRNGVVVEKSLVCTSNEIAGYSYAEDRFNTVQDNTPGEYNITFDFYQLDNRSIVPVIQMPEDIKFIVQLD